jgi:hypothetical protein
MINVGDPIQNYNFKNRSVYFGNKRWSRGVTTVIQKLFASSYRYGKLQQRHKCQRGLHRRRAVRRGHIVDKVLCRWVNGQHLRCRVVEPKALINQFELLRWKPVASQLVVAWSNARIATKIDLVLYDENQQKLLIVEIKSGCHYRRCSTKNGTLNFIRPVVSDAPIHQHQLQALLGKELFLQTYPQWRDRLIESVLVYVSATSDVELITEEEFEVHYTSVISDVLIRTG